MIPSARNNPASSKKMINVLIVDDSIFITELLRDIINSDPHMRVVSVAHNGREAVERVKIFTPDVILMDICMDVLDGVEAVKQIMAEHSTPILIVTSSLSRANAKNIFDAFSHGAMDVFDKGLIEFKADQESRDQLIRQVRYLGNTPAMIYDAYKDSHRSRQKSARKRPGPGASNKIVAIVASTGGPQAILHILRSFDTDFPCGILIVQHIAKGFEENFMEWLNSGCAIEVKIPKHHELIRPAVAYLAPNDRHLRVNTRRMIELVSDPVLGGFNHSGNVLLKSVAEIYGKAAVGVLLTGMGTDGAAGMMEIKKRHGVTIAQDEKSCVIFGMPKAAIDMHAVEKILPLEMISQAILDSFEA